MQQVAPYDAAGDRPLAHGRTADFVTLTKPRLNSLVLMTTLAAYYLGGGNEQPWVRLLHLVVGTALVAAGASALNQFWERDTDRLMRRTEQRPLPDRRLHPQDAMWFGIALSALGVADLSLGVNPLTAAVAAVTLASYVFVYTPLKLRTSLSTIVGAIPGALPAVIGWTAATNSLSIGGWVLFGIVFTAGDFAVVYLLTQGGPFNSTQVLPTWAFQIGINSGSLGEGAAISLYLFPLLVVVSVAMLFFARRAQVS